MNLEFCVIFTQFSEKITHYYLRKYYNVLNYSLLTLGHLACLIELNP
jgi:hypothetical protein